MIWRGSGSLCPTLCLTSLSDFLPYSSSTNKVRANFAVLFLYGNVDLYCAIITKVADLLSTLVSGEKPGFQALSKGLVVLLCAKVVRQGVPDHGAVHSECSASNSG